jgi:Major Facilitator Superfamily
MMTSGWHWVLYWCAIFLGIAFVFCLFFLEETNYDRPVVDGELESSTITGTTPPVLSEIPKRISSDPEKSAAVTGSPNIPSLADSSAGSRQMEYTPKTYLQRLSLIDKKREFHLFKMVYWPFLFFSFPAVIYSGLSYGTAIVWFNVLNGTTALILSAPPYNFTTNQIGLAYLSPMIGVAAGAIYSGYIGDRFALWYSRRNNGVREPEHRLWIIAPSVILVPGFLLLWGVGASHEIHWFGPVFALFWLGFTNLVAAQTAISYIIDTYKDLSTQCMVTMMLIRNTMCFAVNYSLTDWLTNMGIQNTFILAAGLGFVQICSFLVMIKWGKKWRDITKARYYKYLVECRELGFAH